MAPEVIEAENTGFDERSDIWAIGVLMYFFLFGDYPFSGRTEVEISHNIVTCDMTPSTKRKISSHANDLLCQLLTKDPSKRITIDQAINHEWFQIDNKNIENIDNVDFNVILKIFSFWTGNLLKQQIKSTASK